MGYKNCKKIVLAAAPNSINPTLTSDIVVIRNFCIYLWVDSGYHAVRGFPSSGHPEFPHKIAVTQPALYVVIHQLFNLQNIETKLLNV